MAAKLSPSLLEIAIFGTGALGTLFGSRLTPFAKVSLFGKWVEQIKHLQDKGLIVTHLDGSQSHHFLRVVSDIQLMPKVDLALILVKSYQTARVAQLAAKILQPAGLALTLQNGLGNLEQLKRQIAPERASLGVTSQGATVLAPGQLRHAGEGPTYLVSEPAQEKRLKEIKDLFNKAGLETKLVKNGEGVIWGKLAVNAGINPLTALMEVPNGALVENDGLRKVMSAAAREVGRVALAQDIQLPFTDAADQAIAVCRTTAQNHSSMLQDIRRGAPTEIDAICGAIVRLGRQLGVFTPVNERLLYLVEKKQAGHVALPNDLAPNEILRLFDMQI